jgi:hypothetical protein
MNGLGRRADHEWIVRAMISLPVPVSPTSSTGIESPPRAPPARQARATRAARDEHVALGGAGCGAWSSVSLRSSRAIAPGSPSANRVVCAARDRFDGGGIADGARLTHSHGAPPAGARGMRRESWLATTTARRGCGRSANVNVRRIEHPLQGAVRTRPSSQCHDVIIFVSDVIVITVTSSPSLNC